MFGAFFTFSFLSELDLLLAGRHLRHRGVVIVSALMYVLVLKPLIKVSLVSIILATIALSILFENFSLLR